MHQDFILVFDQHLIQSVFPNFRVILNRLFLVYIKANMHHNLNKQVTIWKLYAFISSAFQHMFNYPSA